MGTGNTSKAKGTEASPSGSATGRAARKKVALPSGAAPSSGGASAPRRRPPVAPRPWYRTGRFWLVVILLEVVVAFGLSVRFMPQTDDISLDGVDTGRFCRIVAENQSLGSGPPPASAGETAQLWGKQAEVLRSLQPVAPDEVRPDIDELVVLAQGVRDLAADVERRNSSDPSYDGTGLLNTKMAETESQGELATRRLNLAVLKGCGVDLANPPAPSTTVGVTPSSAGPVVGPTAPAGGEGGTSGSTPASVPGG